MAILPGENKDQGIETDWNQILSGVSERLRCETALVPLMKKTGTTCLSVVHVFHNGIADELHVLPVNG